MKKNKFYIIIFLIVLSTQNKINSQEKKAIIKYVNPEIGSTHCRWFFFTPASVPFGMAKLAPSTDGHLGNPGGWQAVGYDSRHTSIEGFANFHEFQIGGVVLAPTVGKLQTIPGDLKSPESGYRSRFNKEKEVAIPGYYSVFLEDYHIKAELTATKRVGFHRYTFPKSNESNIIFDIGNKQGESGEVKDAYVTYTNYGRIEGYVVTKPVYVNIYQKEANIKMFFSAKINKKPYKVGAFVKDSIIANKKDIKGIGVGLYLVYNTNQNEKIEIKIGLSYTSIENARLNLKFEADNINFNEAQKKAFSDWDKKLSRIELFGGKRSDKIKFYTGLYHVLLGRGVASDFNGSYPKNDGSIGQIPLDKKGNPIHHHYNTDAIWGGFWNLTQLWTIVYPEYYSDWIKSQLLVYSDAGWLGDGIACSKYVSGVGTNFTSLAIASAYNCGIRDFNIKLGYEASLKNEIDWLGRKEGAGKLDLQQFIKLGFSPFEDSLSMKTTSNGSGFGASHTLEYSFSSYAVSQFAKLLGKKSDYKMLVKLSANWKNLFDKLTGLIRPKNTNGTFINNFNPLEPWIGFQEGNAFQYTFYVPHQIEELINLVGKNEFNNRLDSIFLISQKNLFGGGKELDAFSGLKSVYNHGNQPSLHMSWLFNFSGKPYLTQKWVHVILNNFYGTNEIHGYGYGQDEDQGQLGAWYVLSAMGLFDIKGLTEINPSLQIGSPLFDKIIINLNRDYYPGKQFKIEVKKSSDNAIYLQSIRLNNKEHNQIKLSFSSIIKGGNLKIFLSDSPNLNLKL